jgi:hypothetical protein
MGQVRLEPEGWRLPPGTWTIPNGDGTTFTLTVTTGMVWSVYKPVEAETRGERIARLLPPLGPGGTLPEGWSETPGPWDS